MKFASQPLWLLILAAGLAVQTATAQEAQYSQYASPWKTPWDYQGARGHAHWSELDPAYAACNRGKQQSPIDIRNARKADLPPLAFDYLSEPVRYVINNAHTIRVNYHDAPGAGSALVVDGKRYQLTQFHFHRPSEELIAGRRYAMVLHLMHTASDGEVAGVAVLLRAGKANAAIGELWKHLPQSEGQLAAPELSINAADMLPGSAGYYVYTGSVTAPPCTEGVKWFVLKHPVEVSAEQIASFARLYPDDVRPPQPLNGRVVLESLE
jgi:carbonic anhydrase